MGPPLPETASSNDIHVAAPGFVDEPGCRFEIEILFFDDPETSILE
jgi:hypothetical protein